MLNSLIAGFLSGAALIIAIGAQNAFVLRQGIRREHVLPIVLICASADALLILLGIVGLGALFQSAPMFMTAARYGGAALLFAYGLLAAKRAFHVERLAVHANIGISLQAALATCLAFTLLNPHVYLDTVILLGSLANQHGEGGRWWFGAGAIAASFAWFFSLGYGARLLAPVFSKPLAWRILDSLIALTMIGLGAALLRWDGTN